MATFSTSQLLSSRLDEEDRRIRQQSEYTTHNPSSHWLEVSWTEEKSEREIKNENKLKLKKKK